MTLYILRPTKIMLPMTIAENWTVACLTKSIGVIVYAPELNFE